MNVLFLTHRLPYAPNRGDRIRAYYLMREMARFADVSLFSFVHDAAEAARAADTPFARRIETALVPRVRNAIRGAATLFSSRPLTHALLDANSRPALERLVQASPPDVVVAFCSGMARLALLPPLAHRPLVLDMVDVDSAKWSRLADRSGAAKAWVYRREARTLRRFEEIATRAARATLVVNEREREVLRSIAPGARIDVLPNGVDLEHFRNPRPPVEDPVVVFCGVMDYPPNVDAVTWFASEIWPWVRAKVPRAVFDIVGSSPSSAVLELPRREASIRVTGAVPDVRPHLWHAAVSVAPLRVSHGIQNKILEALAAGLPVVTTATAADGLPHEARRGCQMAPDAARFAEMTIALLQAAPAERRRRAACATLEDLAWSNRLSGLQKLLKTSAPLTR